MKTIKYVGLASPWVDTLGGSGLTWTTNRVATVSDDVANELLSYVTIFQFVADVPVGLPDLQAGFDSGTPTQQAQFQASVSGVAVGIGLASSRMRPPSEIRSDAPYQSAMAITRQVAQCEIKQIMIATATWALINTSSETAVGAACQFRAGVRDKYGNKTQITWAGASSVTQANNTTAFSDWITLPIPIKRGDNFQMRLWGASVTGTAFGLLDAYPTNANGIFDQCSVGTFAAPPADLTMSDSNLSDQSGTYIQRVIAPCMIYAMTTRGAVINLGTSISRGYGANPTPGTGYVGRAEIQCAEIYPFANLSYLGATVNTDQNGGKFARRLELINKITTRKIIISDYGTNDLAGGRTSAQLITDLIALRAQLGDCYWLQGDCLPRTDAGNTTPAISTQRTVFNTAVTTLLAPFDGCWEDSSLLESAGTPNTWGAVADTSDGVHLSTQGQTKVRYAGRASRAVAAAGIV